MGATAETHITTKHQVLDILKSHPEWTSRQVADALGCMPEYVRSTAARAGVEIARKNKREPAPVKVLLNLGRAAFLAGLTMQDIAGLYRADSQNDRATT